MQRGMQCCKGKKARLERRHFIGGSDARIIMGQEEKALIRLWQEKRGQVGPKDLSANLAVQFGMVTEDLNRAWYADSDDCGQGLNEPAARE
jgi:predicted phage-related endonuclease